MRAISIAEYGGLEVLELTDQPKPPIKADQVLVAVKTASVNPIDWRIRSGGLARFIDCDFPVILGREVAGVVAGYATLGLSRARGLPQDGEIYELYLRPEYQGIGLGSLLFTEARRLLTSLGCNGIVVWCLEDSDVANRFFRSHGGRDIAEGMEDFDGKSLRKVGFVWN